MRYKSLKQKLTIHFPRVSVVYLDTRYHSDLTTQETEKVFHVMEPIPCRMLSKCTFEKDIDAFVIEINLARLLGCWTALMTQIFVIYRYI